MQFKIIYFGKIKNKNLLDEVDKLKKRISRIEFIELSEVKGSDIKIIQKKEFDSMNKYMTSENYNILLLEDGIEFSTKSFFNYLKRIEKPIYFFITGPYGPLEQLRLEFDLILSLSKMTFTSQQTVYLLIEQLYRVDCFVKNIPYTK
ncbi:MAG: 23S rRNA (pseudouridine(1915)-N(3))-methyltransferase RlmH [archaeon]